MALQMHSQSLHTLVLKDYARRPLIHAPPRFLRVPGTLGNLHTFPSLRTLSAPLDAIIDLDFSNDDLSAVLPPSLIDLRLWPDFNISPPEYCAAAIASLRNVLTMRGQRRFEWIMTEPTPSYQQLQLSGALRTLADVGITCEVRIYPGFGLFKAWDISQVYAMEMMKVPLRY